MSGEDDTFDIDIYGDENDNAQPAGQNENPEDNLIFDDDADYGQNTSEDLKPQDGTDDSAKSQTDGGAKSDQNHAGKSTPQPAQQGTKRKAEDDQEYDETSQRQQIPRSYSQSVDPHATPALKLSDLHWWTTEEDLRAFCAAARVEAQLQDLSFGEHKINGKSRGEAYLEFDSPQAADAVKKEIERKTGAEGKRVNPFQVYFSAVGNPFKGRDSGAQGKKDFSAQQHSGRGGAYNQNFANRGGGGFRGGGGGGGGGGVFNRGGFNNNRGGFQQPQNSGGWNAGGMGMNPMMANPMMNNPMMQNPMMMGMAGAMGYGNMGRGGMMGGAGRGGFGMNARGGFGGGFQQQQGGYGGGGYGMQGGQANKRFKEG